MTTRTKKVKSAGRFGAGYGTNVRNRLNQVEKAQRKKQVCPFCSRAGVKRKAAGIWSCMKCGKTFAGPAYHLDRQA